MLQHKHKILKTTQQLDTAKTSLYQPKIKSTPKPLKFSETPAQQFQKSCKKNDWFVQKSITYAERSNVQCAKHAALLVYQGNIISVGINRYKIHLNSNEVYNNYHEYIKKKNLNLNFPHFTIHAEVDAFIKIYKIYPKKILKKMNLSLYVVRLQNKCLALSLPCPTCQKFLKQFPNLKIYYSC
jgi:deoxycytidylate deaminase